MRDPNAINFRAANQPVRPLAPRFIYTYAAVTFLVVGCLFGTHQLYELELLHADQYALWHEGGYGERFQYGLAYNATTAFLTTAFLCRAPAYGLLAAIMGYLFLDDAFHIHESIGYAIAVTLSLPSMYNMRPDDLGEIIFLSTIATGMLGLLAIAFHCAPQTQRRDLIIFTSLLMLAGVFGIAVDAVHGGNANALLGLIEDGGELITVAIISILAIDRMTRTLSTKPHAISSKPVEIIS